MELRFRFVLAASFAIILSLLNPPASVAQAPMLTRDAQHTPPDLLFDSLKYGPTGHDSARILAYRLPGAPVVIELPSHDALSEKSRIETDWLPSFLFDSGFAMARVRYRDERDISGSDFVAAMARAVAAIAKRAEEAGFDGSRLILMGKGWGGQVAALLATDPHYLEAAGVEFTAVRGAIILDGWGFDLPAYRASASEYRKKQLSGLIEAEAMAGLSPMRKAQAPNAAHFLFYAVKRDSDATAEAEAMSAALTSSGAGATVVHVEETRWRSPGTYPGNSRNPDNEELLNFLKTATGRGAATSP